MSRGIHHLLPVIFYILVTVLCLILLFIVLLFISWLDRRRPSWSILVSMYECMLDMCRHLNFESDSLISDIRRLLVSLYSFIDCLDGRFEYFSTSF